MKMDLLGEKYKTFTSTLYKSLGKKRRKFYPLADFTGEKGPNSVHEVPYDHGLIHNVDIFYTDRKCVLVSLVKLRF